MRSILSRIVLCTGVCVQASCSGVRFIVDAVPVSDQLAETVVLADKDADNDAKIALIDLRGLIADGARPGLIAAGENPVARFNEALQRAAHDTRTRAVVIRINSPGGTVTASDVLYNQILDFKKQTGKPVVISMADVAASGGYYVACAGDEIIAHPTTVTASIGVIIQTINFSEGLGRIGIKADAITSGPNKKMGSPLEPMPAEHRALLQGLVNEFYANFREIVEQSRPNIDASVLDEVTDGRVVTGRRAHEVGLVDQLGDLDDAFAAAKRRAGLTNARLVKYHRSYEFVGSPYASAPVAAAPTTDGRRVQLTIDLDSTAQLEPGFYYLWDPAVW